MNRSLTNTIRFVMDECLPPIIRDSRLFMYPFFLFAYRGRNVGTAMDFKKLVRNWGPDDYADYYRNINTISRNRETDLNGACIDAMVSAIDPGAKTLLDVGCGNGYFLRRLENRGLTLYGTDIVDKAKSKSFTWKQATVENLPFDDKSIDVVTCSHVLEHIIDLPKAVAELKRVAKKQLMVVVPCQRQYYYTLDEHVNFFPFAEQLTSAIGLKEYTCRKLRGDWLYIGRPDAPEPVSRGPVFRDSVPRDSVPRDSVPRDSVSRDSVSRGFVSPEAAR